VRIRQELARHPDVINLEDAYWPNAGWPMLPLLGYLPKSLRSDIHRQGRFGMFLEPTDGEYYGGGILPAFYPRPLRDAALEAVHRDSEVAILRLNEHDETGLGTLFSESSLLFESAARQLWHPTPSPGDVWRAVCTRLYGEQAAPLVEKALRRSESILLEGFTLAGFPLLDHEGVNPHHWCRGNMVFRLFASPGSPVVAGDVAELRGQQLTAWQSGSKAPGMESFRQRNDRARRQVDAGRCEIMSAQAFLEPADFRRLRDIFANASVVLDTLRLLGEAAYSANRLLERDDNRADAAQQLRVALQKLGARACWIEATQGTDFLRVHDFVVIRWKEVDYEGPSLAESVRIIRDNYSDLIKSGE
jgi:hypothetical protein